MAQKGTSLMDTVENDNEALITQLTRIWHNKLQDLWILLKMIRKHSSLS